MMGEMRWLALVVLVALGVAARLLPWADVFRADGTVNLLAADSHYYARFAHLEREAFPRWRDVDPYVNFPAGAVVLWPPLHTWSVAVAEVLAGAWGDEVGVAWVGPAWSLIGLVVVALALRQKRWWEASGTLMILAVSPVAVQAGALGNGDHHVHEVFGAALGVLLLLEFLEGPSARRAVLVGVAIGGARLFTTLGVLAAPLWSVALVTALLAGVNPGARRLALVGLTATGTSLVAALCFGRWTMDFEVVGLFGPLVSLAALSVPVALCGLLERSGWRWAGLVVVAAGASVAPQLLRAVVQLGAGDPLLEQVYESHSAWHPEVELVPLLHSLLFLGPLVLLSLVHGARQRPALWALFSVQLVLTMLGLQQVRFLQAAAGGLAMALLPALRATADLSLPVRRLGWGLAGLLVVAPLAALEREQPHENLGTRSRPALEWLKGHTPSPGPPFAVSQPRYGVLAGALLGHFIELWAERPAVASTFSQTSWHLAGNARAWALLGSADDESAWLEARRLRLAYVVLMPDQEVPGVTEARRPLTLARRLYDGDGSPRFPMLYRSRELAPSGRPQLKVFGVSGPPEVPGE